MARRLEHAKYMRASYVSACRLEGESEYITVRGFVNMMTLCVNLHCSISLAVDQKGFSIDPLLDLSELL